MTRFILAAGVAVLAITAPAGAKPGGGGHGGNMGQAAHADRGGGGGRAAFAGGGHGGGGQRFAGGGHGGGGQRFARAARGGGGGQRFARAERHGGGQRVAMADRGGRGRAMNADRHVARVAQFGHANHQQQRFANRIDRGVGNGRELRAENRFSPQFGLHGQARGLINGCPPGLANKNNGCMPPGQLKNSLLGQAIPAAYRNGIVPLGLQDIYGDTPNYYYRYGDGYMYRVNRGSNLIEALLPLLGGGYAAGQMFPTSYMNSYVPNYYQSFYPDTSSNYYRYANGNVYGIDPYSGMISNVIPMYDNGYGYGQMLPASYSYYNVPYQYRSMYYDTADYSYRYAPGAIYQVDRGSNLITAVASLLAGDIGVGSRLPLGYSAYNVPLAYRSQYYDTPTAMYRYNDGYIYRVDPTSQLVTSVISAFV